MLWVERIVASVRIVEVMVDRIGVGVGRVRRCGGWMVVGKDLLDGVESVLVKGGKVEEVRRDWFGLIRRVGVGECGWW